MYRDYFGFKENPFSIAPDPHFLYMSERHREALGHLLYGMKSDGGFVLVTGEVGAGKTTICRCLLDQVPEHVDVAFILNPRVTAAELLASICDEFGLSYVEDNRSIKVFVDTINRFLLDIHAKGRRAVLVIDEAQNLHPSVLEQIRLLTNLETNERKLLQIIMLGQPELLQILARSDMRQLAQRITARYHLGPLSAKELEAYVKHRLAVAGIHRELFASAVMRTLYRLSGGVPRLINVICDRALLGSYVQGHDVVKKSTLVTAAREVLGEEVQAPASRQRSWLRWALVGLGFLFFGAIFATDLYRQTVSVEEPAAPVLSEAVTELPVVAEVVPVEEPAAEHEEPVVQVEEIPTLPLVWPETLPVSLSKAMAFQVLFARWNVFYSQQEDGDACPHAGRNGLRCLFKRGSLGSLRQYDRPAVLKLYDDQGQVFYGVLVGLEKEAVSFVLGSEEVRVALEELESHWLGEFILLWQVPPGYQHRFGLDDKGPAVGWLEEKLAEIQARPPRLSEDLVLDADIKQHVQDFQVAQGIKPDGIVGPQTLIRINTLINKAVPRLVRLPNEG